MVASALSASRRRTVILVWLGWAVLMMGYQSFVQARFQLVRPDRILPWTATWTNADADRRHPYVRGPTLLGHTAWDSEFYISIALHGYDDPDMPAASPQSTPDDEIAGAKRDHPSWVSLNHAFFPGYPLAMGVLARPLMAAGMDPVGAATAAGTLVSIVATLGAMLAMADLAAGEAERDAAGPADGSARAVRAAFYLVVWPAAAFLAQVYSEGLFLALSFGALALMRRGAWGWAALLAAGAVFTRATGVLLVAPFGLAWLAEKPRSPGRALLALTPLAAYLVWRWLLGADFDFTETRYFGRFPFALGASAEAWGEALGRLLGGSPATRAYELVEFAGTAAALVTALAHWRRDKALSLYSLATFVVVATSGAALGMHRYALAMPSLFLVPARWGARAAFDRVWTLACALGLAVLTLAFSFGFWAG